MSWNPVTRDLKGIRQICRRKILENIIMPIYDEDEWLILIVDQTGMNLLSTCFTTEELLSRNIALIEILDKERKSLLYLSALYIISPAEESMRLLLLDCAERMYKRLHLVFLSAVSKEMFDMIASSMDPLLVLTFKELDMRFLPCESQVYLLHEPKLFSLYFNSFYDATFLDFKDAARNLATLFTTLGEWPLIRYRRDFIKNFVFAETLQRELDILKKTFPSSQPKRKRCQLLILDRGFDCVSPLLHEFTFQAMAYDLLSIKEDLYEYTLTRGAYSDNIQAVPLTEDNDLWCQLRHEHIANVASIIENKIETDTLMEKTSFIRKKGLPSLSDTVKQFILSKKNESFYGYRHMANECMKLYCAGINITSQLEQNLALGTTDDGYPTKDPLGNVLNILLNDEYETERKLRILLLYIFFLKERVCANY